MMADPNSTAVQGLQGLMMGSMGSSTGGNSFLLAGTTKGLTSLIAKDNALVTRLKAPKFGMHSKDEHNIPAIREYEMLKRHLPSHEIFSKSYVSFLIKK